MTIDYSQTDAVNRSSMDSWENRQAREQISARANSLRAERQGVLEGEACQRQLREREVRALESRWRTSHPLSFSSRLGRRTAPSRVGVVDGRR
jgi:hypothetical protein